MKINIDTLHQKLKHHPKISPILLMRITKMSFEICVDLCRSINLLRDGERDRTKLT